MTAANLDIIMFSVYLHLHVKTDKSKENTHAAPAKISSIILDFVKANKTVNKHAVDMTVTKILPSMPPTNIQMTTGVRSKLVIRNSINVVAVRLIRDPE